MEYGKFKSLSLCYFSEFTLACLAVLLTTWSELSNSILNLGHSPKFPSVSIYTIMVFPLYHYTQQNFWLLWVSLFASTSPKYRYTIQNNSPYLINCLLEFLRSYLGPKLLSTQARCHHKHASPSLMSTRLIRLTSL